ncbi:MAG: hypothetical protein ACRC0F_05910 [Cetobacterium sp.]
MIEKDGYIYAGVTTFNGVELFNSISNMRTGYVFKKITDGAVVGNKVCVKNKAEINMYVEVLDEPKSFYSEEWFEKDGYIYAGVLSEVGLALFNLIEEPYTGKVFARIHDGVVFGNKIKLGKDYSYYNSIENTRLDSAYNYVVINDGFKE